MNKLTELLIKIWERTDIHPLKHIALDVLLVFAIGGAIGYAVSEYTLSEYKNVRYANAQETVVKLREAGDGPSGHGSGVVIRSDGLILTNSHVASALEQPSVLFNDGTRVPATVLWKTDTSLDVALLKLNTPPKEPLPTAALRCSPIRVGEPVYTVGHPLSEDWVVTFGHVGAVRPTKIVTDAVVLPGNSGGGLFDRNDKLVGLPAGVAMFFMGLTGQTYSVSNSVLCTLLGRGAP